MTLLELIKATVFTKLVEVSEGCLWYTLYATTDAKPDVHPALLFPVPFTETAGAIFEPYYEGKGPLQRWIRKELERLEAEKAMIEQAKKEWKP